MSTRHDETEREILYSGHPPYCTCKKCVEDRHSFKSKSKDIPNYNKEIVNKEVALMKIEVTKYPSTGKVLIQFDVSDNPFPGCPGGDEEEKLRYLLCNTLESTALVAFAQFFQTRDCREYL